MVVNLYTSRVILQTLGVEDFGINNVVGGVITMLGFLTSSLGAASSRFVTYALGRNDIVVMKKTFGSVFVIHLFLGVAVILIGETFGLWFMTTQLQIPAEREAAAFWVYQFSVLSSVVAVISVPFNASIIAHEKMSAFAYISIMDVILKLVIVYMLIMIPYDKLITYSFLFCCIQMLDMVIYNIYCHRKFKEVRGKLIIDRLMFRELFAFAGWTMNGNLAVIGYTQGLNILLNVFFGPVVNAARGIAVQVQNAAMNFSRNFQMAINPQLTKSYAVGDLTHMHQLLRASSKISFFLMLMICLPIMLEADLILQWWLGIVPEYTSSFLRLILCSSLLNTLANPILVSVHATGKLRRFQLVEGTMLLCIVPVAYLVLKFFHLPPECVFVVHIIVEILTQCARVKIVLPMISMKLDGYVTDVIVPILKVLILAPIIPIAVYNCLGTGVINFFAVCVLALCSVFVTVYWTGCTVSEREFIKKKSLDILNKARR